MANFQNIFKKFTKLTESDMINFEDLDKNTLGDDVIKNIHGEEIFTGKTQNCITKKIINFIDNFFNCPKLLENNNNIFLMNKFAELLKNPQYYEYQSSIEIINDKCQEILIKLKPLGTDSKNKNKNIKEFLEQRSEKINLQIINEFQQSKVSTINPTDKIINKIEDLFEEHRESIKYTLILILFLITFYKSVKKILKKITKKIKLFLKKKETKIKIRLNYDHDKNVSIDFNPIQSNLDFNAISDLNN
jgi:hypothetical protein